MKKYQILSLFLFILIIISACYMGDQWPSLSSEGNTSLPPDEIYDINRSYTGSFGFETLLEVELELNIEPLESPPESTVIIITLHNKQGTLVYTGKAEPDGSLRTVLQLPSAPEDMTLTIQADGFESREIIIRDMVKYSKIKRKMNILSDPLNSRNLVLLDSDGDLVPDTYDAFPHDPDRAFSNRIPADGALTIAFEDLFKHAQAGDADYNDFIAKYFITEITNSNNLIVELKGEVEAVAKMAGYNHLFGIMINSFEGSAELSVDYTDSFGNSQKSEIAVNGSADIVLFKNTIYAVGKKAGFSLVFDNPQNREDLGTAPYNPYLYVYNTGHDIHLIGEDARPGSINIGDSFQDADGFPWALLVPVEWIHPDESQRIEVHYPRFTQWRESFGAEHSDWYLHYDDPYDPGNENNPPYAVIGPAEQTLEPWIGSPQIVTLITNAPGSEPDPDGDSVMFGSSVLPSFAVLDSNTGVITITAATTTDDVVISVWTKDEHGLKSEAFAITLHFLSS